MSRLGDSLRPRGGALGRPVQERLAEAQAKRAEQMALQTSSLPWNLPLVKEKSSSGMEQQREALDKMMGGGR